MRFDDVPNYAYLKNLLISVVNKQKFDKPLEQGKQKKKERNSKLSETFLLKRISAPDGILALNGISIDSEEKEIQKRINKCIKVKERKSSLRKTKNSKDEKKTKSIVIQDLRDSPVIKRKDKSIATQISKRAIDSLYDSISCNSQQEINSMECYSQAQKDARLTDCQREKICILFKKTKCFYKARKLVLESGFFVTRHVQDK